MKFRFYEKINGKRERIEAECVSWREIAQDLAEARGTRFTAKFKAKENDTLKKLMALVWMDHLSDVGLYYLQHGELQPLTRELLYHLLRFQNWMPEAIRKAPEGTPEPDSDFWGLLSEVEPIDVPEEARRLFYEGIIVRVDQLRQRARRGPDWLRGWFGHRDGRPIASLEAAEREWFESDVVKHHILGARPKRAVVRQAAKARFGDRHSDRLLDRIWSELAPNDWKSPGRRPSRSQRQSDRGSNTR